VAIQILTLVDEGKLTLEQMVTIEQRDLSPGSGTLTSLFDEPGISLSLRNYVELMLLISDNNFSRDQTTAFLMFRMELRE